MIKNKKISRLSTSIAVIALIIFVWLIAYPIAVRLTPSVLNEPLNSSYNVLNVLFTALAFGGVIITLIFQSDQEKAAQLESMEKSILDMFQVFTSAEFQATKDAAFRVLIPSILYKEYADFVASRLYAVAQKDMPASEEIRQFIRQLEGNGQREKTLGFQKMERDDRLQLDNVLNFFAMLAQRESAAEIVKHVNFSYDWWRPYLLVIAQAQKAHLRKHPEISKYCKTAPIIDTLSTLDAVFGHAPLNDDADIDSYITTHPRLIKDREKRPAVADSKSSHVNEKPLTEQNSS